MSNPNSYKAYNAATQTVGKTRQLVMLYDAAIRFLQQADEALKTGNAEVRYSKLTRASEIVMALQACLDFEAKGEAANVLNDFYASIIVQIMGLHRSKDRGMCMRIVTELKEMRDTWDMIDRGVDQQQVHLPPVAIADPMGMSA